MALTILERVVMSKARPLATPEGDQPVGLLVSLSKEIGWKAALAVER